MSVKQIFIILFSLAIQIGIAQQNYSKKDLDTFVKVYMTSKIENKRNSTEVKEIFDSHTITPERYQKIAKAFATNEPIELNSNEEQLIKELKRKSELENESKTKLLKSKCLENEIGFEKYSEILNQYRKDIHFQKSLKPHFDDYIKRLK